MYYPNYSLVLVFLYANLKTTSKYNFIKIKI